MTTLSTHVLISIKNVYWWNNNNDNKKTKKTVGMSNVFFQWLKSNHFDGIGVDRRHSEVSGDLSYSSSDVDNGDFFPRVLLLRRLTDTDSLESLGGLRRNCSRAWVFVTVVMGIFNSEIVFKNSSQPRGIVREWKRRFVSVFIKSKMCDPLTTRSSIIISPDRFHVRRSELRSFWRI